MATARQNRPHRCISCKKPIERVISPKKMGNIHEEIWQPCKNKNCKLFNKEVETVIINLTDH